MNAGKESHMSFLTTNSASCVRASPSQKCGSRRLTGGVKKESGPSDPHHCLCTLLAGRQGPSGTGTTSYEWAAVGMSRCGYPFTVTMGLSQRHHLVGQGYRREGGPSVRIVCFGQGAGKWKGDTGPMRAASNFQRTRSPLHPQGAGITGELQSLF